MDNNNSGNPYGFPPNEPTPQQPTYDPYLGTPVPPQNIVENSSPYSNPAYQPQQTETPNFDNTPINNTTNNYTMNQPDYTQTNYSQPNPYSTATPIQENPYMNGYGTPVSPQPTYNPGPGNSLALQPRKKAPKWLWGFSIIPILAIVAVICFFTIPSVKDFVYKNFFSAQKYYERIEEKNANEFLTSFANKLPSSASLANQAFDGNLSFQIDPSMLDELGEEAKLFSDLNCDIKYNLKDGKMVASYIVKKGSTNLLTLNMYADIASQKIYIQIPELSEAYLDLSSLSTSDLTKNLYFTPDISNLVTTMNDTSDAYSTAIQSYLSNIDYKEIFSIIEKYINLLFDEIAKNGKVSKATNVSLTAANVSNDYTEFTIELTQKDIVAIVTNLLNAAKSDKQIIDLLSPLGVSAYYTSAIDSLINQFAEIKNQTSSDALKVISYVDGDDNIIGRNFHLINDGTEFVSISYATVKNGKNIGFEVNVKADSMDTFTISCNLEKADTGYTGVASIIVDSEQIDINFKDVTYIDNEKSYGKLNGTFTVNIPEANNATLEVVTTASETNQAFSVNFAQDGTKLLSVVFDTKKAEVTDSVLPSESATYYDLTDESAIEQYIENANLEAFLQDTFAKLGITDEATIAAIISELTGTSVNPPSNEDPIEGGDNDNGSNYDPLQYGLPAGTEIDEYGYYRINLEEKDLVAGVAGTGYLVFNGTKDSMQPTFDSILKKLYKTPYDLKQETENYISGNVSYDIKDTYQLENYYYTDKENYTPTLEITYDSVTKQLIKVTLSATLEKKEAIEMVKQILEGANGKTLSNEDKESITTCFDGAIDSYSTTKLGSTDLYVSGSGDNSYYIVIEQY